MQFPKNLKKTLMRLASKLVNHKDALEKLMKDANITPSPEIVAEGFQKKLSALQPEQLKAMEKKLESEGETLQTYAKKISSQKRLQFAMALEKWSTLNLADKQTVSDEEAEAFYRNNQNQFLNPESVTVSHILIRNDVPRNKDGSPTAPAEKPLDKKGCQENVSDPSNTEENDERAKLRASKIRDLITQGGNFEKLAAEYSDCPSGKKTAGGLGTIPRGKMMKEFEDVAFDLAPGQISGLIKTRYGYHIIMVTSKNKQGYLPFPKVKRLITELLSEEKTKEAVTRKVEQEKKNFKIKINL